MLETVKVPPQFEPLFEAAQKYVSRYFREKSEDPTQGTIEIFGERYILVRAASMSVEFFDTVARLYETEGVAEANNIARQLLFDIAHAIGKQDAKCFHEKMKLGDPIEKLSAGPVHFSHSGWAYVDIFPESRPSPDSNYYLIYDHPYSFESAAWIRSGRRSDFPVCVMNAGYSSGWCEESFGVTLVASEIMCQAKGDQACRFIMAPPSRIEEHIAEYLHQRPDLAPRITHYEVPGFFKRKEIEEERRRAREQLEGYAQRLEAMVEERTADLRRREQDLRKTVEALRIKDLAMKCSLAAITVSDLQGNLTYVNPSFLSLCGYTDEREVLGRPGTDIIQGPGLIHEILLALRDKGSWSGEARGTMRNGRSFVAQVATSVIHDEEQRPIGLMGSFVDLTEQRQMEERLQRAERLAILGQLAGGVGHELRNPLGAIKNAAYFLKMVSVDPDPQVKETLEILEREVATADRIIGSLLAFARTRQPMPRRTDLNAVVEEALRRCGLPESVEVQRDLHPALPSILTDPEQIVLVLANLVANAVQAMPEGGRLSLSSAATPTELVVSVGDTGCGIPDETLSKIFEPLFSTKAKGIGLGLAISKMLVEANGGTIAVESEVGVGSTFRVKLPLSGGLVSAGER